MSDAQSVGGLCGEVRVELLWAVRAGAGVGKQAAGPLGPALHGEGGLPPAVNVRVGAVVFGRSRAHGEVFGRRSDLPPGREAVAGAGRLMGNVAAQQIRQRVAAETETVTG